MTSVIKHLAGQVRIRLILQLIKSISKVLQKLLKYFNGTIILTFFLPAFPAQPSVFVLNLNQALLLSAAGKSAIAPII